ncbi:hypothetical protein jhhlp_002345 [Lomentospora prolificans]|uniref:Pre-mRNA-splicing factor ATP-dependent RNA helicase PRP16 n=1 Tax=Lomentospora prolificans TaxID=41688 RepID=A0A2N3NDU8_9PEZI|nr:hypothetical protein jhhlp_002345 [Lomentospora prolificans]
MDDNEYTGYKPKPRYGDSRRGQSRSDNVSSWRPRGRGDETPRNRSQRDATPVDMQEEPDDYALDRDWYAGDDGGGHALGDEFYNPFGSYDESSWENALQETSSRAQRTTGRFDAHREQRQRDNEAWEMNRMVTSGVAQRRDWAADFDDEDTMRVHLLTHELRPPFLEGKTIFTRQQEPVSAIRDPQGHMAVASKKGSKVVKEARQQRERQRQAQQATSMAGTMLGKVMGVRDEDDDADNALIGGEDQGGRKARPSLKPKDDTGKSGGASSFSQTKSLREQREFLPAFSVREDLLRVIRENQVVIVVGETGSGKTTQLTQYLYEEGYGQYGMIGCTQPRRVAAMSVAKRVAEEMEVPLGSTVGYSIRFEDYTSKETVIKYLTDGILLRESMADSQLEKYSCIIMDEAHERALNTDILLGLFKKILQRRRDLKLIVTSATMNSKRFSDFFGGAPEFFIPGRTFPVDIMFHKSPVEDYVDQAVQQVLSIHVSQDSGDILVFMTGQEDIEVTCELVQKRLDALNDPPKLSILPIYSQMPADLQAKIFDRAAPGVRKCIVATNIAETSLTVDGIKYVVDAGFSKLKVYNPKIGMDTLQITPISQANASQRAGRAGRTGPGKAYHLFTEKSFKEELYLQTIPEIQRTNLANTVLQLKALGVKDLLDFDFMDPPPQDTMTTSMYDLWALGALDNLGDLTELGRKMSMFPMEPSLSKLLITSIEYGCSEEMITIVSMLSVPNVFYRPKERQEEADVQREKFWVHESDHLTFLQVYSAWKANRFSDGWCTKHFLHSKSLRKAKEVREQLVDIMNSQKMELTSCGTDWDIIRKCICSGYYHQAAKYRGSGEYINLRTNVAVQLHPTSSLYASHPPDYLVYHELILTTKVYVSTVTAVDPHWLADLGGVFYSIKEKGYSVSQKKMIETEFNRKMEIEAKIAEDKKRAEEEEQRSGEKRWLEDAGVGSASNKKSVRSGGGEDRKIVQRGAVRKVVRKKGGFRPY